MFSTLAFCLTAIVLCTALALRAWQDDKSSGVAVAGVLAAPALVILCLAIAAGGGRFGELRLTLKSYEINTVTAPFLMGGGQLDPSSESGGDDLVIEGLPHSLLSLSVTERGGRDIVDASVLSAPDGGGLVSFGKREDRRYPGTQPLAAGDAICIAAPCQGPEAVWAVLETPFMQRAFFRAVQLEGGARPMPGGVRGPPLPKRKLGPAWSPQAAIHPLRDFFPRAEHPGGATSDCDIWYCVGTGSDRAPARSFVFQNAGRWWIVLGDPQARIIPAASATESAAAETISHENQIVTFWRPVFWDQTAGPDDRRGAMEYRGHFSLSSNRSSLKVVPMPHPVFVVGHCQGGGVIDPVRRLADPAAATSGSAVIEHAGERLAGVSRLPIPLPERNCEGFTWAAFTSQDADRGATASYTLERLGVPWTLAVIVALCALVMVYAAPELSRRMPVGWALLAALQFLLGLRALVGLEAATIDPSYDWRAILFEASVAYAAGPVTLVLWLRRRDGAPTHNDWLLISLVPATYVACLIAWSPLAEEQSLAMRLRSSFGINVLMGALWVAAIFARFSEKGKVQSWLKHTLRWPRLVRVVALRRRHRARIALRPLGTPRALFTTGGVLLLLLLVARLVAWVFGVRERFGLGLLLLCWSAIYTPVLIFALALALRSRRQVRVAWHRLKTTARVLFTTGGVLLLLLLLARLVALAFGIKERFSLGPLLLGWSVIYTPVLVIAFAQAWTATQANWKRLEVGATWLLFTGALALPALANDKGFVIVFGLIFLAMLAWLSWSWWGERATAARAAADDADARSRATPLAGPANGFQAWISGAMPTPARSKISIAGAILALLFILFLSAPSLLAQPPRDALSAAAGAASDEEAARILKAHAENDNNQLRLLLTFAPEGLATSGTRTAEGLRAWSVALSSYTEPLIGRGYMSRGPLGELEKNHLDDNVSAVHLISPFGRLAALAFLGLLALLPLAAARLTRSPGPRAYIELAGLLALWAVFGMATYMILANLQLVLFTGRNVYFLSAYSGSDLLEGLVLFALAAAGLTARTREVSNGVG